MGASLLALAKSIYYPYVFFFMFMYLLSLKKEQELIAHKLRNMYIIAQPWHIRASKVRTIKPFKAPQVFK